MKAEWTNADNLTPSQTTGKSVLVIETPKNCAKCKLMYLQGVGEGICNAVDWEEKPDWCPLRPLPTDMIGAYANSFAEDYVSFTEGWDSYKKALMGETE